MQFHPLLVIVVCAITEHVSIISIRIYVCNMFAILFKCILSRKDLIVVYYGAQNDCKIVTDFSFSVFYLSVNEYYSIDICVCLLSHS